MDDGWETTALVFQEEIANRKHTHIGHEGDSKDARKGGDIAIDNGIEGNAKDEERNNNVLGRASPPVAVQQEGGKKLIGL